MIRRLLPVVTAVMALPAAPALADSTTAPPETTLSVNGNGIAFVVPDVATLEITVRKTLPTAVAARNSVAKRTGSVIGSVLALGVPRSELQSSQISLSRSNLPRLHKKDKPRVRYNASESVTVRLTDVSLVGPVLDAATRAGADDFSGPDFSVADPSAGLALAEGAALADARKRADSAAAHVGYRVSGVRSIDLDPNSGPRPVVAESAASASAPTAKAPVARPTPVAPGRQEVDATVAVVFVLTPAP